MRKQILHKVLFLLIGLTCLGLFGFFSKPASAANPTTVNFQGKVVNSNGTNVTDGTYSFIFRIYNTASPTPTTACGSDSACLFEETQGSVTVTSGVFQVELGSSCSGGLVASNSCTKSVAGGLNFNSNNALYLTLQFNGDTSGTHGGYMWPVIHFTSVPYAFYADNSGALSGLTASNFVQLAQGLQTDSSTSNASIAINKTNASGSPDILLLQKSGKNALEVNNSGTILLGQAGASGLNGTLTFNNSAGSNTVSFSLQANPGTSYTLLLPTTGPSTSQCLQSDATTANQLVFSSCSAGGGVTTVGTIDTGGTPVANGAVISGSNIYLQSADSTHPGLVNNTTQTLSGDKTLTGLTILQPASSLTNGQVALQETFTNGSSTGGTVDGLKQTITVTPTSSASTTNGIEIALTDATTLTNTTNGVNATVTDNGASGAKTNTAVKGTAGGSNTSAVNYGGYFSLSGGSSSGSAIYASNGSTAGNILQLQDNSTDILAVGDGGKIYINSSFSAMGVPSGLNGAGACGTTPFGAGILSAGSTYRYKITAIDSISGETTPSTEASIAAGSSCGVGVGPDITISWSVLSGASGYKIYRTAAGGAVDSETYLATTSSTSYTDAGYVTPGAATPPSSTNAVISTNNSSLPLQLSLGGNGSPTGQLYVSGTAPLTVGSAIIADPNYVFVQGPYAYLTTAGNTLEIVDISNPVTPQRISSTAIAAGANSVFVQGKYAYTTSGTGSTFAIYNISNPSSPSSVVSFNTLVTPTSVYVQGKYAYVADNARVREYDISNPASAAVTTNFTTGLSGAVSVYVQGKYGYAGNSGKLSIFDVSNPFNLTSAGSTTTGLSGNVNVYVQGKYAYVTSASNNTFEIIDIGSPSLPTVMGTSTSGLTTPTSIYVQGRYAYIGSSGKLSVFDVTNASSPTLVSSTTTGLGSAAISVYGHGRYVYAASAASNDILAVFDVGGAYIQQLEAGGADFGALSVEGNLQAAGDVAFNGGVSIGEGLQVNGIIGLQPAASLTNGATHITQAFTNASSSGGTVQGYSQTITISNTSTASTTIGFKMSISDATALQQNVDTGISLDLSGITNNFATKTALSANGGSINQTPTSPTILWPGMESQNTASTNTSVNSVFTAGNYEYVAVNSDGSATACSSGNHCELLIYDISNASIPVFITSLDSNNAGTGTDNFLSVYVSGHYLYVGKAGNNGACSSSTRDGCELQIYDISSPASPSYVGGADSTTGAGTDAFNSVFVYGRYVYVGKASNNGTCSSSTSTGCELQIYDISNPASPTYVGGAESQNTSSTNVTVKSVFVAGNYAYIATDSDGSATACSSGNHCEMLIYNVANPSSPSFASSLDSINAGSGTDGFKSVNVSGRYAYVGKAGNNGTCSNATRDGCELQIYDISNQSSPTYKGGFNNGGTTDADNSVVVSGRYAYVGKAGNSGTCASATATGCEFQIYDINDPTTIAYKGGVDNIGTTDANNSVFVSGRYAYVGKASNSGTCSGLGLTGCELQIYDLTGIEATSVNAHSLSAGTLQVQNIAQFNDQLGVAGSLSVGQDAQISGDLGIGGSIAQIYSNTSSNGGTFDGYKQTLTVAPTSSASTTNGIEIAITDATTLTNTTNGVNATVTDNGASGAKTNKAITGTAGGSNTSAVNYGGYFSLSGGAATSSALYASNGTATGNILQLQDNSTDVLKIADGGLVTLQPGASLTTGQSHIIQTLTSAPGGGTTNNGYKQDFTVSPTGNAATANGFNIALTDSTALANTDTAVNATVTDNGSAGKTIIAVKATAAGSNGSQLQYALDASANHGISIRGASTGTGGSVVCGPTTAANSIGVCGTTSQASSAGFGGYFAATGNGGTALYSTNGSSTSNIMRLQDNTTDVLKVADGGAVTIHTVADSASALLVENGSSLAVLTADTLNLDVDIGSSTTDANADELILDSYNQTTDPAGTNGAIYYNTNGAGGTGGNDATYSGKFRCFEGNIWRNCLGLHDFSERRFGYAVPITTAATALTAVGMTLPTISGSCTAANGATADSNYVKCTSSTTSPPKGGGYNGPYTLTEARWLPLFRTKVTVDANLTAANGRMWIGLASSSNLAVAFVPTTAGANSNLFLGIAYQDSVNSGKFVCVSGDATNWSGTDMGVTATASHVYDIIVDYSTAGQLICSIADDGATGSFVQGAFTSIIKSSNTPAASNSTALGIEEEEILGSGSTARALSIAYLYLEYN